MKKTPYDLLQALFQSFQAPKLQLGREYESKLLEVYLRNPQNHWPGKNAAVNIIVSMDCHIFEKVCMPSND